MWVAFLHGNFPFSIYSSFNQIEFIGTYFKIQFFLLLYSTTAILAPSVIKKLEQQLHFEAKVLFISEMCFDRISRFIAPECSTCKQPFESFDDCYEHYLVSHGRSAFWNCCNLLLETPYDLLDHLKYHECIDVFK